MTTARDIAAGALLDIGVLAEGEVMTASQSADALRALNDLIDQWAAERLTIFEITRSTWTITSSGTYTVGSGGDVNIVRPVYIDTINYQDTSLNPVQEIPLYPFTDDQWAAVTLKGFTSSRPSNWYYNPTFGATGRGTLTLWPAPTDSGLQGVIYAPTAITELASLDTTISLPPGYRRFLRYQFAVDRASSYGVQIAPSLQEAADKAEMVIKRANVRMVDLQVDRSALVQTRWGGYNIRTGP